MLHSLSHTGVIVYGQGVSSLIGLFLVAGADKKEVYALFKAVTQKTNYGLLFKKDGVSLAYELARKTWDLTKKRNLSTYPQIGDPSFSPKIEGLLLSWFLTSFSTHLGLPEFFSLFFLIAVHGLKALVAMALAILESTLSTYRFVQGKIDSTDSSLDTGNSQALDDFYSGLKLELQEIRDLYFQRYQVGFTEIECC